MDIVVTLPTRVNFVQHTLEKIRIEGLNMHGNVHSLSFPKIKDIKVKIDDQRHALN